MFKFRINGDKYNFLLVEPSEKSWRDYVSEEVPYSLKYDLKTPYIPLKETINGGKRDYLNEENPEEMEDIKEESVENVLEKDKERSNAILNMVANLGETGTNAVKKVIEKTKEVISSTPEILGGAINNIAKNAAETVSTIKENIEPSTDQIKEEVSGINNTGDLAKSMISSVVRQNDPTDFYEEEKPEEKTEEKTEAKEYSVKEMRNELTGQGWNISHDDEYMKESQKMIDKLGLKNSDEMLENAGKLMGLSNFVWKKYREERNKMGWASFKDKTDEEMEKIISRTSMMEKEINKEWLTLYEKAEKISGIVDVSKHYPQNKRIGAAIQSLITVKKNAEREMERRGKKMSSKVEKK